MLCYTHDMPHLRLQFFVVSKKISVSYMYVCPQYALVSLFLPLHSFSSTLPCWVRSALARYIPCLGALLCVRHGERLTSSSFMSTRRSTVTSQVSEPGNSMRQNNRTPLSSVSDSESVWTHLFPSIPVFLSLHNWSSHIRHCHSVSLYLSQALTDTEMDMAGALSRQVSYEGRKELSDFRHCSSLKVKVRGRESGSISRSPVDAGLNLTDCVYISVSKSPWYCLCTSDSSVHLDLGN